MNKPTEDTVYYWAIGPGLFVSSNDAYLNGRCTIDEYLQSALDYFNSLADD